MRQYISSQAWVNSLCALIPTKCHCSRPGVLSFPVISVDVNAGLGLSVSDDRPLCAGLVSEGLFVQGDF